MSAAAIDDAGIARLAALGGVLLPGDDGLPAADTLDFATLLRAAIRACGYDETTLRAAIDALPEAPDWDAAGRFAVEQPDAFHVASTLVSAAYFMAPAVLTALRFPIARQFPAEVEEFVAEFETGILDPVMERGKRYRMAEGAGT